jgi:hypothetical protein
MFRALLLTAGEGDVASSIKRSAASSCRVVWLKALFLILPERVGSGDGVLG